MYLPHYHCWFQYVVNTSAMCGKVETIDLVLAIKFILMIFEKNKNKIKIQSDFIM